MTTKLTPGNFPLSEQLGLCACMGPMYGEPECYCSMVRLNLPLNESAREADRLRFDAQMTKLFEPGGLFANREA